MCYGLGWEVGIKNDKQSTFFTKRLMLCDLHAQRLMDGRDDTSQCTAKENEKKADR